MKRVLVLGAVFALLAVLAFSTAAFAATSSTPATKGAPTPALSAQEVADLQYMREEEKVARDVYITLYNKWRMPIFNNISASERQHMDSIKTMLTRYNVADPAKAEVGAFTNPKFQQMYDTLIAQGDVSPTEALKAGVTIEETDIQDLTQCLTHTTRPDIKQVYTNLRNASYNHLNAFTSQLGN
jgi:hypothetical protein